MDRLKLDVVRISEVRWQDERDFWSREYRVTNTKSVGGNAEEGLNTKISMQVSYYEQNSEPFIVAKIDTKPTPSTAVQVYKQKSSADDEDIEELCEAIKIITQIVKGEETLIAMGYWNSVVGNGREGNVVGEYGRGKRKKRSRGRNLSTAQFNHHRHLV